MKQSKIFQYLTPCIVGLITGGLGVLAYSPFDLWAFAYLSMAGLIWVATRPARKIAMWATFAWSIAYFCFGISWIHVSMIQFGDVPLLVSYLAVFGLACYLSLYNLLFTFISHRFGLTNPFVLASLFTFTEYLRGWILTGFPWLQFGYSQIDSPFASIAPILGVEGVTFFVVVTSGYLLRIFTKSAQSPNQWRTALATFIIVIVAGFGSRFVQFIEWDKNGTNSPLTVSLVQGNIEQKMKWDPAFFNSTVQTYVDLIKPLIGKSDLIILPESAIPDLESRIQPLLQQIQQAGAAKGSEVIIGTLHQSPQGLFNSAVVLGNPQQPYVMETSPRYNKAHLVPFGEYVPFGNLLDFLREVFVLPVNLTQGEFIQKPLIAKQQRFTMAICYEIIFGDQVQQNQKASNADYLLTISNDAWFGTSIGPWQHFQMARMRALELGKPLIRSTNTGVTAVVDPFGQVLAQIPQFEATVLTTQINQAKGQTLFSQTGNLLIYGLSLLIFALGLARKARR